MGTNYWTSKVLPKIKKVFEKNGTKKAAAAAASKTFDEAKEQYAKEFEEKKTELQPKVVEIYEASSVEIKTLIKEPKVAGLRKQSAAVQKFLEDLDKIEFPGSKAVCEACTNFGPAYVSGPVFFVFEKVSTFVVTEEVKEEEKKEEEKQEEEAPAPAPAAVEKPSGEEVKEKEIVIEEEKKEEEKKEEEKKEAPVAAETSAATAEPPKAEEAVIAPAPAPAPEAPKP